MVKLDNPVRLSRLSRGLSQKQLAADAGIARMTLVSIEEGSTRTPDQDTLSALAKRLGDDVDALRRALDQWHDDQPQATYTPGELLARVSTAHTFADWREQVQPSATRFATELGVARSTLTGYEQGRRTNGMPDKLVSGLMRIGCSIDTVQILQRMPPR